MTTSIKIMSTTLLTLLFFFAQGANAFGANGHRIVAGIAENHLTAKARKAIVKITDGHFLAKLATWPDEIRSDSDWDHSQPWHYVSIDDNESFDNYVHSKKGDILLALEKFEKILKDKSTTKAKRWEALAFFVHFSGDIHQPLHVGRRDDFGGNSISVQWFGKNTKLHAVWDSNFVDYQQLSYTEYVAFLDHASKKEIKAWQKSTYLDWAKESKAHRKAVYDYGEQRSLNLPNLGYAYIFNKKAILEERLLRGGIRLAGKLNAIFADK